MTETVFYETRAEADAFLAGISKCGSYEAWIVQRSTGFEIKYYRLWNR